MKLKVGDKKKLVYTLEPIDATVKEEDIIIKSSDEDVLIIDKDLTIHALKAGKATITISAGLVKTEIEVTVDGKTENTKSSSALIPCVITSIVTFFLTVVLIFVIKHKKEKDDDDSSPSVNENGDFKFDM
jgi:hypothetical protein